MGNYVSGFESMAQQIWHDHSSKAGNTSFKWKVRYSTFATVRLVCGCFYSAAELIFTPYCPVKIAVMEL
jgi:hypothetical protein